MTAKEFVYDKPFHCEAGGVIEGLKVAYHISEGYFGDGISDSDAIRAISRDSSSGAKKVVWITHALTANSDPSDWWPELVSPGKFFDTGKYIVVCANMLGSAYGSSGPASLMPGSVSEDHPDGRPYYFSFPKVTVRDIVNAEILLRKYLGIEKIDLVVGGSIGGFQALEWAIMESETIRTAAFIACGPRVSPWLTAHNEAQRMALEADVTFRACESLKGGEAGLKAARAMALISYRSYEGYNATQPETSPDTVFADRAASYERYQGKKLADRFDAYSYWYLTYSVDSHNIGRGRGGVEAALNSVKSRSVVIGIDSDDLFPVEEQKFIASNIPDAEYHEITSRFGHDGFLLEYGQISAILKPYLDC